MRRLKDILGRLKALREEKALKQERVAECLGIERSTYVRKELGEIPITTEEWIRLAEAMGKDPAYFFAPESPPPREKGSKRELLCKLYSSLNEAERDDLLCVIHLMLKKIKRKTVQNTLKMLCGM